MPRPDPAVRARIASQRARRTTHTRGVRLDVDVLPYLSETWLRGWPLRVRVIEREGRTDTRRDEPIHVAIQTEQRLESSSRTDDCSQLWSPLACHMGYTRTPEQRDAILAAIRRMTWIAMRLPQASLLMQINPAACTIAAALTHASPLRSAAIALVEPGQRLIGLADVTGARHYLLGLRVEAIHVLTEPSTTSEQMPGYARAAPRDEHQSRVHSRTFLSRRGRRLHSS